MEFVLLSCFWRSFLNYDFGMEIESHVEIFEMDTKKFGILRFPEFSMKNLTPEKF
jgi:hypothetical protein